MIYIFDFDDTLTCVKDNKVFIPDNTIKTLDFLKKNKATLVIVSFNMDVHKHAKNFKIDKYFDAIHCDDEKTTERFILINKVFNMLHLKNDVSFNYFDDRLDNIGNIKAHFNNSTCFHIKNSFELYKSIIQLS